MPHDRLSAYFDRLDAWRHLPAYALERRSDALFGLYLPEVLVAEALVSPAPTPLPVVIPEFPVSKMLLGRHAASRASINVDFLAISVPDRRAYLVELKTDVGSLRDEQDEAMGIAHSLGLEALVRGVLDIFTFTSLTKKYGHLLVALHEAGLLHMTEEARRLIWAKQRRGMYDEVAKTQLAPGIADFRLDVVYVQPRRRRSETPGVTTIDFPTFAAVVGQHNDPLSQRFVDSLHRWTVDAGHVEPTAGTGR